jgi:aminoglycoside phosphotransferase (APT) family kinase protein
VRLAVTLGERVGIAVIMATIDSLEKQTTVQVEPGPSAELIVEHKGLRVNERWFAVALDTTFVLRVSARDAFGNLTPVASLARRLRETQTLLDARTRIVRLVRVEEDGSAALLTFRAVQAGRASFKLVTAGVSAAVWLEVVPAR